MTGNLICNRLCTLLAAASLGAVSTGAAMAADAYTATAIPPLTGGTGTNAAGVNNSGMVVGQADDALGNVLPYVFENGVTTALPLLTDHTHGGANSVNSAGVIVGFSQGDVGPSRAVKWVKVAGAWTVTDLGTLKFDNSGLGVATRINDAGQIVGYSTFVTSYHACIWDNAPAADLGTLNFVGNNAYSQGLGISNSGWVTGFAYAVLQGPEHGFSQAPGARSEDITPAGQFGLAQWHNVNDGGRHVGYIQSTAVAGSPGFHPATFLGGEGYTMIPQLTDLPEGYGYDINNAGTAVGTMFLLAPFPEPNIFRAFKFENGATADLNAVTTGLPGTLLEAKDISETGLIAGTSEGFAGPIAVLLTPVPVAPPCLADFDGNHAVAVTDIFSFLSAWFSQDSRADFNGDRTINVSDIFSFLSAWFAGC